MPIPATLKRRCTAFSPNVVNYASRCTALFIATFGSCDVMPFYHRRLTAQSRTTRSLINIPVQFRVLQSRTVKVNQRRNSINSDHLRAPTT